MASKETLERYLHAILTLGKKYCYVRSVDVAHYLKCTKASVSVSVNQLIKEGLLVMEEDGNLQITDQGHASMKASQDRSAFFQRLLADAGLDPDTAEAEAFSMAKAIRPDTFDALKNYLSDSR